MNELKFRLALEDKGIEWDLSDKIVDLVNEYLIEDHDKSLDKVEDARDEIQYQADRGLDAVENLDALVGDLEVYTTPVEGETLEDLQGEIKNLVWLFAREVDEIKGRFREISTTSEDLDTNPQPR